MLSAAETVEPIERPTCARPAAVGRGEDYIRVRALVRGERRDGHVIGWRGERVYLQWRSDEGNHLGWVAAADVERK